LFAMILDGLGYTIELAVDGVDCLERARSARPSVILMDLAMPNMDGFEATRRIRAIPELASVHIIAVTAFCDAVSAQRALAAGCNEVLAKPCAPELLTARVQAAVVQAARDAS
jgi:two-component system, cell cycle response regulator DivK